MNYEYTVQFRVKRGMEGYAFCGGPGAAAVDRAESEAGSETNWENTFSTKKPAGVKFCLYVKNSKKIKDEMHKLRNTNMYKMTIFHNEIAFAILR